MARVVRQQDPSSTRMTPRQRDAMSRLVDERNSLVSRLETGSERINQLRSAGHDVSSMEEFWMRLLRRYEDVCDRIADFESRAGLRRAS